jgi:hypothetical protein
MSSLHDVRVSYRDPAITGEDPSLGHALERVLEAQQGLVVRRLDLFVEETAAKAKGLVTISVGALAGAIAALAGWFIAIAGVIDALDDHFSRSWVEIGTGALHIASGVALLLYLFRRRPPEMPSPEIPS